MSGSEQSPGQCPDVPEHRHENDPTGIGMVNDGPEKTPHTDPCRPDGEGAGPGGNASAKPTPPAHGDSESAGDPGAPGDVPGAFDDDVLATLTDLFADGRRAPDRSGELDEVALRRMLHGAVGDLTPSEGTLDRLQRAVPARRARRRQAVVGTAAAALLIGTAVPAFVHVAASDGPPTARPAIAGHGEQAQGGNGEEPGPEEQPGLRTVAPTQRESEGSLGEAAPDPSPSRGEGRDPDASVAGQESDSPSPDYASLPVCDPGQLGVASASTGAPGADGTVYGSFRIANVSGSDCRVTSNGTVGFTARGAADSHKIVVVQHAEGDAAPGLPDPSEEPGTVLLKPAMAYEVQFAWVPTDTCPTVRPSPTPTPSADGAGGAVGEGSEEQTGVDPQSLSVDGGTTAEGSVAVTHTPETGAPTAQTEIPDACSGTIYRTGVLATSP
ncbi:hypothetical protein [Streptomyces sp. YPW6]|uniref:hypothetical protein n=1 Tax=Streptomyces sp. YPW6 TaxID=2840373 RepID=UPI003EB780E4